jgi:hypothetical protein
MSPVLPILPLPVPAAEPGGASRPRAATRRAQNEGDGAFLLALAPELAVPAIPVVRPAGGTATVAGPEAPRPAGPGMPTEETATSEPAAGAAVLQLTQGALLAYAASRATSSEGIARDARSDSAGRAATGATARLSIALAAAAQLLRTVVKPVVTQAQGSPAGDATSWAPAREARPVSSSPAAPAPSMPAATVTADPAPMPPGTPMQAMVASSAVPRAILAAAPGTGPEPSMPPREDGAPSQGVLTARPAPGTPAASPADAAGSGADQDHGDAGTAGRRSPRQYGMRSGAAAEGAANPPATAAAQVAASGPAFGRTAPGMVEAGPDPGAATAGSSLDATSAPRLAAPANQVTLQFSGEEGLDGRLRLSLRGSALHATIIARDPDGARQLESGLDELRQALGDRGFTDARVTVQGAAESRAGEPRPERQEQHASHREDHADRSGGKRDGDLDSSQGNPRRRSPRRQSER